MFKNFSIVQKLWICGLALAIPLLGLSYLMIDAKNERIIFNTLEVYGNKYQRPLQKLLEEISWHKMHAQDALLSGDPRKLSSLEGIQTKVDMAFSELKQVHSEIGVPLQFTQEGLAKRKREHMQIETINGEWSGLKSQLPTLNPSLSNEKHDHLISDIRTLITHGGDTSNLILDPDLDSYYLMDLTLLVMPQVQDRIQEVLTFLGPILDKRKLTEEEKIKVAVYSAMLTKADLERIEGDVATSLNEDQNFSGISASLHKNLPPAASSFSSALRAFIHQLNLLVKGDHVPHDTFKETGHQAWNQSINLFRLAIDELDTLINVRIDTYKASKRTGLILAGLGFSLFVLVSIYLVSGLTRTLNAQISTIAQAALMVQNSSKNISSTSLKLSDSTTEQAAAIEETSSSMAEMSAMLNQTTKNSALTLSEAEDGQKETAKGGVVISKMMAAMDEIHAAKGRLESLVNLINEIQSKTRVINNIVFETRLLSFNASIEAARAGVHGKGFAVVAEEVGKLAAMSGKAAEDIRALLDSGTSEVSEVVATTQEKVQMGRSISQECSSAFDSMSNTLGRITESVRKIAQAAKEQEVGVKQTTKAMGEMDVVTHRNSSDAESLSMQAKNLTEGANSLLGAIHGLKAALYGNKAKNSIFKDGNSNNNASGTGGNSNNIVDISTFRQTMQKNGSSPDIFTSATVENLSSTANNNNNGHEEENSESISRNDSRWSSI